MNIRMPSHAPAAALTALVAGALGLALLPGAAPAQAVSKTAMAGPYAVTLKVLPAESFSGPGAAMARDAGAEAAMINGPEHPNHHMVAFVKRDGKPVERATVTISYRRVPASKMGKTSKAGPWTKLPVARMHVAGQSLKTTHYGNNVSLEPGTYQARVTVNGKGPAIFRFTLQS
jgi:hypothetical protein